MKIAMRGSVSPCSHDIDKIQFPCDFVRLVEIETSCFAESLCR